MDFIEILQIGGAMILASWAINWGILAIMGIFALISSAYEGACSWLERKADDWEAEAERIQAELEADTDWMTEAEYDAWVEEQA